MRTQAAASPPSLVIAALALALSACQPATPPPPEGGPSAAPPEAASAVPAGVDTGAGAPPEAPADAPADASMADAPPFAGKTWRVVESEGVQPGTTYAFVDDGTLVIDSGAGNPPGHGKWRWEGGKLTIEEDGVAYPTDVLRADAGHLELRSHNPGGTLDIKLERMPDAPLQTR